MIAAVRLSQRHRWSAIGLGALLASTSCAPNVDWMAGRARSDVLPPAPLLGSLGTLPNAIAPVASQAIATVMPTIAVDLLGTAGGQAAAPFHGFDTDASDQQRSLDCLTAAVYYEARSEPIEGQRAVAQVVLNRVRHPAFPHSVCGVVFQGSERSTGCQFTFTCDGSMDRPRNASAWDRSRAVAAAALAGSVYAPVGLALNYHADYVLPWWAQKLVKVATVGSQIFYRWAGGLGGSSAFNAPYSGSESIPVIAPRPSRLPSLGGPTAIVPLTQLVSTAEGAITVHRGSNDVSPVATAPAAAVAAVPAVRMMNAVRVHAGFTTDGDAAAAPIAAAADAAPAGTHGPSSAGGVSIHYGG